VSRICLVRHGATSWTGRRYCGRADPRLTAVGRAQADEAADRLAAMGLRVGEIRTSPLRRARQTAARIARRLDAPVIVDERLVETDFGAAEGLTLEAVRARWPELVDRILASDPAVDWPDGESAAAARARATEVADDLRATPDDVVVVSHGMTIRALADLLASEPAVPGQAVAPPGGIVVIAPASASVAPAPAAASASAPAPAPAPAPASAPPQGAR